MLLQYVFLPYRFILPVLLHHQQVEVVHHKTPCVNHTSTYGQQPPVIIMLERQVRKNIHKPPAILIIVEDSLTIYPTHHHMIDANPTFLPCTPRHDMTISIFVILLFRQRLYIPCWWQVVRRLGRRNHRVTKLRFQFVTSGLSHTATFLGHFHTLFITLGVLLF